MKITPTTSGNIRLFIDLLIKWKWIGITIIVPIIYFMIIPWVILILVFIFPALNGSGALAKIFEASMAPATGLARTFDVYGEYFWTVLTPLGG